MILFQKERKSDQDHEERRGQNPDAAEITLDVCVIGIELRRSLRRNERRRFAHLSSSFLGHKNLLFICHGKSSRKNLLATTLSILQPRKHHNALFINQIGIARDQCHAWNAGGCHNLHRGRLHNLGAIYDINKLLECRI